MSASRSPRNRAHLDNSPYSIIPEEVFLVFKLRFTGEVFYRKTKYYLIDKKRLEKLNVPNLLDIFCKVDNKNLDAFDDEKSCCLLKLLFGEISFKDAKKLLICDEKMENYIPRKKTSLDDLVGKPFIIERLFTFKIDT